MEKIFWVKSYEKKITTKENCGLEEVNKFLEEGWTVKLISACSMGDSSICGQAYIVLSKED